MQVVVKRGLLTLLTGKICQFIRLRRTTNRYNIKIHKFYHAIAEVFLISELAEVTSDSTKIIAVNELALRLAGADISLQAIRFGK